jgi:hypothetical protein
MLFPCFTEYLFGFIHSVKAVNAFFLSIQFIASLLSIFLSQNVFTLLSFTWRAILIQNLLELIILVGLVTLLRIIVALENFKLHVLNLSSRWTTWLSNLWSRSFFGYFFFLFLFLFSVIVLIH